MSASNSVQAYTPRLDARQSASDLHAKASLAYAEKLWRRAEGAAQLGNRDIITEPDVEMAIAEILALRQGGYASGVFGGLFAGAAFGAVMGWLPDLAKVQPWHWAVAFGLGLVGLLLLGLSARRQTS